MSLEQAIPHKKSSSTRKYIHYPLVIFSSQVLIFVGSHDKHRPTWGDCSAVPDRENEAVKEEMGMLSNASAACNKIHFPKHFYRSGDMQAKKHLVILVATWKTYQKILHSLDTAWDVPSLRRSRLFTFFGTETL